MARVKKNTTIKQYQDFVKEVYSLSNDRNYSTGDMLINVGRFTMRGLKGIRKKDPGKTRMNLIIAVSWFMSMMNQLHIDLESEVWKRFPYLCSYCGFCPCQCREEKPSKRRKVRIDKSKRPKTLEEYQMMFNKLYPAGGRTLDQAGVHLAEEYGEFSEAILIYRGNRQDKDFEQIELEAADMLSCYLGVFNSLGIDLAKELSIEFSNNCHMCKKSPCQCSFISLAKFKS